MPQITPQNIMKLEGWQLEKAFSNIPPQIKAGIFGQAAVKDAQGNVTQPAIPGKLNLNQLLLILSKIQFSKKNDELEDITKQLKGFTEGISHINNEVTVARQNSNDDKPYTWPPDILEIASTMDQRLGTKMQERSTKANVAVEQLGNYSKQMNEEAKRLSAEASRMRQELSALQETMSSILDTVNKAVKRAAQNF